VRREALTIRAAGERRSPDLSQQGGQLGQPEPGGAGEGWEQPRQTWDARTQPQHPGAATSGLDQDVVPEPYHSVGIDVLLDRGLITITTRGYRPSDEVIFASLDLWQY
jgi:hypothetical protein